MKVTIFVENLSFDYHNYKFMGVLLNKKENRSRQSL